MPEARLLDAYSTSNPEEAVCVAARNDYRSDGLMDEDGNLYDFAKVMENADCDDDILEGMVASSNHPYDVDGLAEDSRMVLESKKRTLLRHLMKHGHWGPFEHPQAVMYLDSVSRVLMAQITRHRQFSFDVMSLRYVNADDREYYYPDMFDAGEVATREGVHEFGEEAAETYEESVEEAFDAYERLIDCGVPQEEARRVLPMATKVNILMSANARAWMHILNVRTKADVQDETRKISEQMFDELSEWMSYTFETYDEEILPLRLNP